MADTPPPPYSGTSTPPSSAADLARMRKERREAKIKAGGSARLNKISGVGGGLQRDPPPQPASTPDPEEVDISQHYYQPAPSRRPGIPPQNAFTSSPGPAPQQLTDDQRRAMMLAFPNTSGPSMAPPNGSGEPLDPFANLSSMFGGAPGAGPAADDPMMQMMMQMMGGMPADGASGAVPPFGGMGMGMGGLPGMGAPQPAAPASPYAYVWRVVHAVFALSLGLYIALTTSFTGTKAQRELSGLANAAELGLGLDGGVVRYFYIFASCEVVLQTTRFLLEGGKANPSGMFGVVMGFLPLQLRNYLEVFLRYGRIWTTVSGDAMVCVFVLGVCSWLRAA